MFSPRRTVVTHVQECQRKCRTPRGLHSVCPQQRLIPSPVLGRGLSPPRKEVLYTLPGQVCPYWQEVIKEPSGENASSYPLFPSPPPCPSSHQEKGRYHCLNSEQQDSGCPSLGSTHYTELHVAPGEGPQFVRPVLGLAG